jgi:hypothetical protein
MTSPHILWLKHGLRTQTALVSTVDLLADHGCLYNRNWGQENSEGRRGLHPTRRIEDTRRPEGRFQAAERRVRCGTRRRPSPAQRCAMCA